MRIRPVLLGVVFAMIGAVVAHADDPETATLEFSRDEALVGCPTESVIRRTVAAHLGWDPFRDASELRIVATLVRDGDELAARVRAFDASGAPVGEREFRSSTDDCPELARAMALAISVAIDPFVLTRSGSEAPVLEPEEAPEPPPDPEPASDPPAAEPDPVVGIADAPRVDRSGPTAGCAIGVAIGVVPAVRPFVDCLLELRSNRFALGFGLRYDVPASADGPSGGRVVAHQLSVAAVPCFAFDRLRACGVARLGLLLAKGEGVDTTRSSVRLVPRLGVLAAYDLLDDAFVLRPFVSVEFALVRPDLRVNFESASETPVVSGSLGILLAWRAP